MTDNELHALEPGRALEMYLQDRQETDNIRESTVRTIRSRVGLFIEWCDDNGIEELRELDGIDLHKWRLSTAKGISKRTVVSRVSDVRTFLRWARSVDAVPSDLPEKIDVPDADNARETLLEADVADAILDYLRRFRYASRDHVILLLFWRTGMRLGALRSLDLKDYHPADYYTELVNRPETETPLKNGEGGERAVALSEDTCMVISDYIDHNRIEKQDDYGREPLLTTHHGRISTVATRRTVYRLTRPCVYSGECPVDKDSATCTAAQDEDKASQCPETVSPHDIRRGALTAMLRDDVPKQVVSDRCDVSPDVLDKHYNQMTEREKMEQRREYIFD